jgi:hypothetical protein
MANIKRELRVKCDIGLDVVARQCPPRKKKLNFFYYIGTLINILFHFLHNIFKEKKVVYCLESPLPIKGYRFDFFFQFFFQGN